MKANKLLTKLLALTLLTIFGLNFNQRAIAGPPEEFLGVPFERDGKGWTFNPVKNDASGFWIEIVPEGQTVDDWKEMQTYQFTPGAQKTTTAQEFRDKFVEKVKSHGVPVEVTNLSDTKNDVMFEWRILSGPLAQSEIDRIIAGNFGIHFYHYATKNLKQSPAAHKKWIEILKDGKLQSQAEMAADEGKAK
jgi:hypothetical protein